MSDTTLDRIDRYCDLRERAIDAAEERGTACIDECALLGVHELRALIAAAREAERQYAVVAELRAQLEAMTSPIGTKNGQGLGARVGLNLRISKADRAGFDAAAARAGITTSEWARTILRREAGLWTGSKEDSMKTIKSLAIECADEAWAVLLQGATVSRVDGEVVSNDGTNVRPVVAWEPMLGDWEALDEMLGHKASRGERMMFDEHYRSRLVEIIKSVDE